MSMPAWKYYEKEDKYFEDKPLYHVPILSHGRADVFIESICDKYNLPYPKISYKGRKFHSCGRKEDRITFCDGWITLGILCHEMAHHYTKHKLGHMKHNDELFSITKKLLNYINNYVMDEKDRLGVKHSYNSCD